MHDLFTRGIGADDTKVKVEKRVLTKLKQHKSGLMHDLLTGKVSVNVDSDAP